MSNLLSSSSSSFLYFFYLPWFLLLSSFPSYLCFCLFFYSFLMSLYIVFLYFFFCIIPLFTFYLSSVDLRFFYRVWFLPFLLLCSYVLSSYVLSLFLSIFPSYVIYTLFLYWIIPSSHPYSCSLLPTAVHDRHISKHSQLRCGTAESWPYKL
jgi:hypothetical protein